MSRHPPSRGRSSSNKRPRSFSATTFGTDTKSSIESNVSGLSPKTFSSSGTVFTVRFPARVATASASKDHHAAAHTSSRVLIRFTNSSPSLETQKTLNDPIDDHTATLKAPSSERSATRKRRGVRNMLRRGATSPPQAITRMHLKFGKSSASSYVHIVITVPTDVLPRPRTTSSRSRSTHSAPSA